MALVTYLDGARKLLNQYVIAAGDATGAQSLSIDVSALAKNNGKECTHVSLNKVYFNVHRVYGRERFPLLIKNWHGLHCFGARAEIFTNNYNNENETPYQPVHVLRNT